MNTMEQAKSLLLQMSDEELQTLLCDDDVMERLQSNTKVSVHKTGGHYIGEHPMYVGVYDKTTDVFVWGMAIS